MASVKEISTRIRSIQDTKKITKAMYMISSIKLRKAKKKLEETEPFFYGLQSEIASILYHFPEVTSRYFTNTEEDKGDSVKNSAYLVITGDKGMCGAYNHNVIKETDAMIKSEIDYNIFVVGAVGRQYYISRGYNVDEGFAYTATDPTMHRARNIALYLLDLFDKREIDNIKIVYTRMVNSMVSEVETEELLPLKGREFISREMQKKKEKAESEGAHMKKFVEGDDEDYSDPSRAGEFAIYPSPEKVLDRLVENYVIGYIYSALVESSSSEENARMMAMDAATDNAEDILKTLSIQYNKVRQASITQEITEVIGGAKALKKKKLDLT
jgi:F-type H+-transporting ATPase subunit gamma